MLRHLNETFAILHTEREDLFWQTKMGTSQAYTLLEERSHTLLAFGQERSLLESCHRALNDASDEEEQALRGWIRYFESRIPQSTRCEEWTRRVVALETALEQARSRMPVRFRHPVSGRWIPTSVNRLALQMNSDPDERLRRASYEAFEDIERFVLKNGLLELIRARNELARARGFENYYEYVVQSTEGITLDELFGYLDELKERTTERAQSVMRGFLRRRGQRIRKPWNLRHLLAGDITHRLDGYLSFKDALPRWLRTFAGLGIDFQGAGLVLDLVERAGKYENGFCIAPVVTWLDHEQQRIPARIHLTSNAVPGQIGSGLKAATTLFHEGGHAAHFANISMNAPCFSQEYAPTSLILAETQSMFCDSLLKDADWLTRYGLNEAGESVPPALIATMLYLQHPMRVLELRSMLVVAYVERALYSMPEDKLEPETVLETVRKIEQELTLLERSPRPTLAVPHLLSGDASCIYHGYILAEAAVEQTRAFFVERDGHLLDNPRIGPALCKHYWEPGNSRRFVDVVSSLTGRPFGWDALLQNINASLDDVQRQASEQIRQLAEIPSGPERPSFSMQLSLVHGHETIAACDGHHLDEAVKTFAQWLER